MKLGTQGSWRSLIMNRNSKLRISKCRIQYGHSKCKKWLDLNETRYLTIKDFEVTDNDLWLRIRKLKKISSKMTDQNTKSGLFWMKLDTYGFLGLLIRIYN